jgi:hypothetical protein
MYSSKCVMYVFARSSQRRNTMRNYCERWAEVLNPPTVDASASRGYRGSRTPRGLHLIRGCPGTRRHSSISNLPSRGCDAAGRFLFPGPRRKFCTSNLPVFASTSPTPGAVQCRRRYWGFPDEPGFYPGDRPLENGSYYSRHVTMGVVDVKLDPEGAKGTRFDHAPQRAVPLPRRSKVSP